MGKSLTEVAKEVLSKEQISEEYALDKSQHVPSMGTYDKDPDRDAKATNANRETLKPGSKHKEGRFKNPNSKAPDSDDYEDLGGATPTSTAKENLGAKAAKAVTKDTSKASKSNVGPEPAKKLSEDEELDEELEAIIAEMIEAGMSDEEIEATLAEALADEDEVLDEEIEISEEMEAFIAQKIEEGLSDEEIEAAIAEEFELVSEEEETVSEEAEEAPIAEAPKVDMREHVDALLEGESLSEEFREKATTIFESAVNAKLEEEVAILEDTYKKALAEEVEKIKDTLAEQVDDYLNYVVENWVAENEVAIEPALRTELTEDFITGLRNLFAENYINIPDDKVDIVEELGKKVDELESKLNEEIENNVHLTKQLNEAIRHDIVAEACDGLTDTQSAKLESLVENVEFTTSDEFSKKVQTIKENYFPSKTPKSEPLDRAESVSNGQGMIAEELQGPMAAYVKTLGKKLPK